MTNIIDPNLLAFAALHEEGKVALLSSQPVTATGTGTATSGFDGVAALIAKLTVDVVSGSPTVTVKVQHSPDGTTWADLISFDAATADGVQYDRGESPDDYVRATWTVTGSGSASLSVDVAPVSAAAGGGGSQPAGSDGEIQFNDGGTAFGASPDLVWDGTGGNALVKLATAENGTAQIIGNGIGVQVQINAADGDATHVGGELTLKSGGSAGLDGGDLNIIGGQDSADGSGASINIASGQSVTGDGGDIDIRANPGGPVGGQGGQVFVQGGPGVGGGGNVVVQGGAASGNVQVYSGDGNQGVQIDNTGLIALGKVGFYGGAPVAQPAAPATLGDVIAGLQALGLFAT